MKLVAHMDHSNAQTFEVSDLEKLIKQVGTSWVLVHFIVSPPFYQNVDLHSNGFQCII